MQISILIPAYNEEKTIGKVVMDFKKQLPESKIYVCDNNSGDKTAEIAEKTGAHILRENRLGKGYALQKLLTIKSDIYVVVDGDDTYPAEKVKNLILKYNSVKVFTHSSLDQHKDHKAVSKVVESALEDIKKDIPLFAFEIWNIKNETHPRMYVDISETFNKKIDAIKKFKSQRHYTYPLLIPVYFKARIIGLLNGYRYGERFYKIR